MSFKDEAKKHQINYCLGHNQSEIREGKRVGRAQSHWLNEKAAKAGKNFYSDYVFKKVIEYRGNKNDIPEWFYDTLRSQHISFNFFIPLIKGTELNKAVWKELLGINISTIGDLKIEYPSSLENPLKDRTSFDAFILYTNTEKESGILGIEVKYTEGGYSPTNTERELIDKPDSIYYSTTRKSGLYNLESCNIDDVKSNCLRQNKNRQIWRNHLLAFTFAEKNKIKHFHSITLYHEGNTHFKNTFNTYLTDDGKNSLKAITFSKFCKALNRHATKDLKESWVNYLVNRYKIDA
jgi:hypothetical protein